MYHVVLCLQQDLEEMDSRFRQEQDSWEKRIQALESENEQVVMLNIVLSFIIVPHSILGHL